MNADIFYQLAQTAAFSVMLAFGLCFVFDNTHKDLNRNQRFAMRLFGIAFITWSLFVLLGAILQTFNNTSATVSFYLLRFLYYGLIMEIVFSAIIDSKYPIKENINKRTIYWLSYGLLLLLNVLFVPLARQNIFIIIAATIFAVEVFRIRHRFIRLYNKINKESEDFIGEDMNEFAGWLKHALNGLTVIGIVAITMPLLPKYVFSAYLLFAASFAAYMAFCTYNYMRFASRYKGTLTGRQYEDEAMTNLKIAPLNAIEDKEYAIKDKQSQYNKILDTTQIALEKNLSKWIKNNEFLKQGITMNSLAEDFNTNRTYLSTYINTRYKTSFRNWISDLRIDYSKTLLSKHPELSTKQIAEMVGYAASSYISAFYKATNMSPAQWRKENSISENEAKTQETA